MVGTRFFNIKPFFVNKPTASLYMKKINFRINGEEGLIIIYRNRKRSRITASVLPGIHVKSGAYIKAVGSAIENIA